MLNHTDGTFRFTDGAGSKCSNNENLNKNISGKKIAGKANAGQPYLGRELSPTKLGLNDLFWFG